ncbi:MAG TPA: hypothetical protein VI942_11405 [Thermoanaerobaculia bacterium]|nr:hypothetical protein [Thermoanaerobaculia bacterium]
MRRRAGAAWGLAIGAVAAIASHAGYWYLPRERGATPSPEARALVTDAGWQNAIWIAYPHQNLGRLERRVGEIRSWISLARGAERSPAGRVLPRLGPFAVPPASELAVAERAGGEIRALLRVYPAVRLLAKAAGGLASNPWLAGGEVRLGADRVGQVAWKGAFWTLESAAVESSIPTGEPVRPPTDETSPLALVRIGRAAGPLPAATYRLVSGISGLELRTGPPMRMEPADLTAGEPPPMAWMVEVAGRRRASALLLWQDEGALAPFPAAATLGRGPGRRHLPGEELLRLAGREPIRRRAAGFEIRALGRPEADRAAATAQEVSKLLAQRRDLRLLAGADLDRLRIVADRIADRFRGLPIARLAGFDTGRLASILAAAEGCGTSRLELREAPERLRWLLCPGSTANPAR